MVESIFMSNVSYTVILGGFGFVQAVVVAVIAGLFNREAKRRKKDNEAVEHRAAIRAEESRLSMRLMSANSSLASATGIALKEGRVNGKMDAALISAAEAQDEYFAFVNKLASSQIMAE